MHQKVFVPGFYRLARNMHMQDARILHRISLEANSPQEQNSPKGMTPLFFRGLSPELRWESGLAVRSVCVAPISDSSEHEI